jgi:ERCC4-type nuclease
MTDRCLKEILQNITVMVDSREHEHCNDHILNYFDQKGISYVRRCLKFGDYSFELSAFPEHGTPQISFENKLVFERKANLTELSGNLCQARERFEAEFTRANEVGAKAILLVEDGSWQGILDHKYRSELNPQSYFASLFAFRARYGIEIEFIPSKLTGWYMLNAFRYYAREFLKGLEAA